MLINKMNISNIILCALVLCCVGNVSTGYVDTTDTEDGFETHPNVHLLPKTCGDISGRLIHGGDIVRPYEFPWMTLISYKGPTGPEFDCSGTIINSKYILTAGHCADGYTTILGVRVGEYDISNKTDCQGEEPHVVCQTHLQDIQVENIILHPNYSKRQGSSRSRNDIALLRLKKRINFNYENALPICLPVTQELLNVPLAGMLGTVVGWGLTEYNMPSQVPLKVKMLIHTDEECRSLIYKTYSAGGTEGELNEICAGEDKKDSCKGDSGGPLMVEGEYEAWNRYIQYGIVSRGSKICGSEPGIYTDVTKYMGWILDNIEE